jgi:ferric-dicitrate binding protein FerR (iron transport regulator)
MMLGLNDERLVEAFVEKARRGVGLISQERLDEGWERLQTSAPDARPLPSTRPTVRSWLLGLATAGALAVLAVTVYRALPAAPALRYVVSGTVTTSGNVVTSVPGQQARLLFSDDSRVDLEASTTIEVDTMDAQGAHIVLVDGALDVYVEHRANTSWRFAAGPFRVKVKGTAFRLGFAADRGRLSLRMTSGSVEVLAPSDRTIAVGAGESLELYAAPPLGQAAASPPTAKEAAAP